MHQFPKYKILGVPVSWRMCALVYMAFRDEVDVVVFHKGIQYVLEKLGKLKFGFERTVQCSSDISGLCIRIFYAHILRIRVCQYAHIGTYMSLCYAFP